MVTPTIIILNVLHNNTICDTMCHCDKKDHFAQKFDFAFTALY